MKSRKRRCVHPGRSIVRAARNPPTPHVLGDPGGLDGDLHGRQHPRQRDLLAGRCRQPPAQHVNGPGRRELRRQYRLRQHGRRQPAPGRLGRLDGGRAGDRLRRDDRHALVARQRPAGPHFNLAESIPPPPAAVVDDSGSTTPTTYTATPTAITATGINVGLVGNFGGPGGVALTTGTATNTVNIQGDGPLAAHHHQPRRHRHDQHRQCRATSPG